MLIASKLPYRCYSSSSGSNYDSGRVAVVEVLVVAVVAIIVMLTGRR